MIFKSQHADLAIPALGLGDFALQSADKWHDRVAFIDGPSGRTTTFGQVADGARRLATALAERGFRKGDVFAVCCPNVPEYAIVVVGVALLGGITTTMNPLYTEDELAFQLEDTRAKALLTLPAFMDKLNGAATRAGVADIYLLGHAPDGDAAPAAGGKSPTIRSFASLLQANPTPPRVSIDPARDVVVLPYSSGTSGKPKGVMLTHRNLVAVITQIHPSIPIGPDDRQMAMLPFFHIFGLVMLMLNTLVRGNTCVTMPRFELLPFLTLCEKHRINKLFIVPPIAVVLSKAPELADFDLSSIDYVLSGAAPLDEHLSRMLSERLRAPVVQGYGMTETSLAITTGPRDAARAGCAGRVLPNMELKLLDTATGVEVGPGDRGEILVRGPNIMAGYLNRPEATRETLDADGWLHTGDVGVVDAEGNLFVVDRVKELIKYNGMQVAPAELEGVLLTHPAVADVAIVPSPDEAAGEVPKAFVVLRSPCSAEELMTFVAERVAPHKKVRLLDFVAAIPKSATGKILRRVLVEQERARISSQASSAAL